MDRLSESDKEANIQAAVQAYQLRQCRSARSAAYAFSIPYPTLEARLVQHTTSRSYAQKSARILSSDEEKILVLWISRIPRTRFLVSTDLVVEMAEKVRRGRSQLSQSPPASNLRPIGSRWFDHFRTRNPEIQDILNGQIDGAQYKTVNTCTIQTWFDVVTELCIHQQDGRVWICSKNKPIIKSVGQHSGTVELECHQWQTGVDHCC
jgi:hypothetical protein